MNKMELSPTEDNLIKTLCEDTIGRNKDILYFYNLLQAQTMASAIAIDGRWGSGKTFFVKQSKLVINALNKSSAMEEKTREQIIKGLLSSEKKISGNAVENENFSIAVYYDAWENDNDTDPILSIIYQITMQLGIEFSLKDKTIFQTAGAIIESISGKNIHNIADALSSDDPYTIFKSEKKTEDNIKDFLMRILEERGNRLIIFIDELDRCRPSFAVRLLEQIKHYFHDERITYVFSVNSEQLQHTIRHYYGNLFDACRYLDKFFDLRITLPPANMDKFYCSVGLEPKYRVDKVIDKVINMYHLELREIIRLYSQLKTVIYEVMHNNSSFDYTTPYGKGRIIILSYIVPLMVGLKMVDESQYNDFVNGMNSAPLKDLLESDDFGLLFLCGLRDVDEAFMSGTEKNEKYEKYEKIVDKLYNAVFVERYLKKNRSMMIGGAAFSKESKKFALEASGMMVPFADYNN